MLYTHNVGFRRHTLGSWICRNSWFIASRDCDNTLHKSSCSTVKVPCPLVVANQEIWLHKITNAYQNDKTWLSYKSKSNVDVTMVQSTYAYQRLIIQVAACPYVVGFGWCVWLHNAYQSRTQKWLISRTYNSTLQQISINPKHCCV